MTYDGVTYSQPQDIVNSFADYFMSVYSTSSVPGKSTAGTYTNSFWSSITLNKLDQSDVEKALKLLQPKISFGCMVSWSRIAKVYSSKRWHTFLICPWSRARFLMFGKVLRLYQFIKRETRLTLKITAQ
jgi:hypothetical protein